jgi:hypothetical protein
MNLRDQKTERIQFRTTTQFKKRLEKAADTVNTDTSTLLGWSAEAVMNHIEDQGKLEIPLKVNSSQPSSSLPSELNEFLKKSGIQPEVFLAQSAQTLLQIAQSLVDEKSSELNLPDFVFKLRDHLRKDSPSPRLIRLSHRPELKKRS